MADLPRPLTDGEIALLKSVFGGGLNYGDIRIDQGGIRETETHGPIARTRFDTICFPTPLPDFSPEAPSTQAWLIHEAVHVWQWQQFKIDTYQKFIPLWASTGFDYHSAYEWSFSDGFSDMNIEQQAQTIEDRYRVSKNIPPKHETDWHPGQSLPILASYDRLLQPFDAQNAKGPPPHRNAYGWNRDEEDGGGFSEGPSPEEALGRRDNLIF